MSDNRDQQPGGYDPADPWAPPNRDGVELSKPAAPSSPPVHDQQTVTSMPAASGPGGDVPPPPVAPGGPAATPGGYGHPADTAGSYGYPAAPAPMATSGYGYPGYPGYGGQQAWPQALQRHGHGRDGARHRLGRGLLPVRPGRGPRRPGPDLRHHRREEGGPGRGDQPGHGDRRHRARRHRHPGRRGLPRLLRLGDRPGPSAFEDSGTSDEDPFASSLVLEITR